jgi:4-amino-4-deoxy-L-arabinose transferase-like glycosyltransferase
MQAVGKPAVTPKTVSVNSMIREWSGLVLVILLAVLVRGAALGYDLPFIYHPDEPVYVNIIHGIYHGDLNPHFFNYPTLFFYLNALAYLPVFGISGLLGNSVEVLPVQTLVMGATQVQTPAAVLLSRWVSVLFGLGSVAMLFIIGRMLSNNPRSGLVAALLLAVSPTTIKINRFITPDTFVVFFILGVIYFSLCLYRDGRRRDYVLAGIFAGLAASSKYNAGLVVLAPVIAHFLRYGWNGFVRFNIYRAMLACGLAFLFTSPFVLLDITEFWKDFTYEARHYSSIGHPGMEGDSLNWYLSYLWMVEGAGVVLGAVVVVAGFVAKLPWFGRLALPAATRGKETKIDWSGANNHVKRWTVVFAFPLLYFFFISGFVVRNDRTLLPVIPFLLLAAGLGLSAMLSMADRETRTGRLWLIGGLVGLLLSLAVPVLTLWQYASVITQPVPEAQARAWINTNLPPGTSIALESYSPHLDTQRYRVTPIFRAIMKDFAWYRDEGIEYIVFAKSMYGRYYCDPLRYPIEKGQYDRLFNAFDEAAVFYNPIFAGPIDPIIRGFGVRSVCLPRADLVYTHEIKILKVR